MLVPEDDESRHGVGLWLRLLINHVFIPSGYNVNGEISWEGEDREDAGVIFAKDNQLEMIDRIIVQPGPSWAPIHFADGTLTQELRKLRTTQAALQI